MFGSKTMAAIAAIRMDDPPTASLRRAYAERLHGALDDPAHSVLVLCDPEFHALEIVTGVEARRG